MRIALALLVASLLLPAFLLPGAADAGRTPAATAKAAVKAKAAKSKKARKSSSRRMRLARANGKRHAPGWLRKLSGSGGVRAFAAGKATGKPSKGTTTTPPPTPTPPTGTLRFGIYPGGGAGAVGPRGEPIPEDPVKRLAAVKTLAGSKPFVLHLYEDYTKASDGDAIPSWLKTQVDEATANGLEVEMVLRYRPAASGGDVAGYTSFVRKRVRQYGANPGVTALQITNEANITVAPDAADGWYPGARQALVQGVIAADAEARAAGITHQKHGFNWAYGTSNQETAFFSELGRLGGSAFAAATDWVGIDAYPGTWGPSLPSGDLASAVRSATIDQMRRLRTDLMPLAGLGASAGIRFAENGYPTDDLRTEAKQVTVMTAAIQAINEFRGTYGVTDYRWFDLRDADSTYESFESHYGITKDDYSPKPAFFTYRDLITQLG